MDSLQAFFGSLSSYAAVLEGKTIEDRAPKMIESGYVSVVDLKENNATFRKTIRELSVD